MNATMEELKHELSQLSQKINEYTKGTISLKECGENLQAITAVTAHLLKIKPKKPLRLI